MENKRKKAQSLIEYVVIGGLVAVAALPLISPYAKKVGQIVADSAPQKSSTISDIKFSEQKAVDVKGINPTPPNLVSVKTKDTPAGVVTPPILTPPPAPPPPTPQRLRGCQGEDIYSYSKELQNLKNSLGSIASVDNYNAANWDPVNDHVDKKTKEYFDWAGYTAEYGSPMFYDPNDPADKAVRDIMASNTGYLPSIVFLEHAKIWGSPGSIDTGVFYSKQTMLEAQLFIMSVIKRDQKYVDWANTPLLPFGQFNGYLNGYYWRYMEGINEGKSLYQIREEFCALEPDGDKFDPLRVTIDGNQYMFVQDKNGDGKFGGPSELLGFSDTKATLFQEMKSLDKNGDGYVSAEELASANIKLLKVENGVLTTQEYSLNNLKGIRLNSFETSSNNQDGVGEFGTFEVELQDGVAQGQETFDFWDALVKLFTQIKDFVFSFF